jgi:uncharacterized hydrophobic protein (TIGR00271 family)
VEEPKPGPKLHVVAAIGEPAQQPTLTRLACAIAHEGGLVTLLTVTPDGSRPEWLSEPEECLGVRAEVEARRGDDAGRAILDAVEELEPDLLILGWSGEEGSRRYLLGSTLDPVIRYAPCEVVVARADEWPTVEHALVAAGGGPNASAAIELALQLSPHVHVTALYIARETAGQVAVAAAYEQLAAILEPWRHDGRVEAKVVRSSGAIDGILSEARQGYDALLIGASNESYVDRELFGNVPQTVAAQASIPTLVVRRRASRLKSVLRRVERVLAVTQERMTMAERVETYREVRRGARPQADFFFMTGFAAAIASLGLIMNSAAVVIGAMVIAPLMTAILGVSLGIVQGDVRLLWQAAGTTLRGAALAALIGLLVGLAIPLYTPTSEILSRTQPQLIDLVVAILSGAAGAYAQCRRNVLGALAGVAVAVALVPPLAIIGIGVRLRSGTIAGGALLLFFTNLSAIISAGSVVFLLFGFRPDPGRRVRVFGRGIVGVLILLGIVSGLLTLLTISSIHENRLSHIVDLALMAEISQMPGVELISWTVTEEKGNALLVNVEVRSTGAISRQEALDLQERVASRIRQPVTLVLSVIPYTQLAPLPTPTLAG